MARGKRKNTIIKVKSAPSNSCVAINHVKASNEVTNPAREPETTSVAVKASPDDTVEQTGHINVSSTIATHTALDGTDARTRHFAPRRTNRKKRIDDAFIEVELKIAEPIDNVARPESLIDGVKDESARKKENNKNINETDAKKQEVEINIPDNVSPIEHEGSALKETPTTKIPSRKPTGCFGFISTWLAKRKERRREKKRKAIERRTAKSVESLVVYGQKSARGGVAFTVELDSRPMRKLVLPVTRQRTGHIGLCSKQKMERAEDNRAGHISKRIQAAQAHDLHVMKVGLARAQNEYFFKLKTLQKIQAKEDRLAQRAASQLDPEDEWDQMSVYGCEVIVTSSCSGIMEEVFDVESDLNTVSPDVVSVATVSPVTDGYCTDEDLLDDCSIEPELVGIVT